MYLVQIVEKKLSNEWVKSPSIEKLQSFDFQLFSSDWCVLDCVPENGALFEVHYGQNTGLPVGDESDRVYCVMLAPDPEKAFRCASISLTSPLGYDHAAIFEKLPDYCILLHHGSDIRSNKFRLRLRP